MDKRKFFLFKKTVGTFYSKNRRDFLWRNTKDPYKILVSEIMLQQTQVSRVLLKYPQFIDAFPDFKELNKSSLAQVLKIWQGMGYNRRVLYLKKIAEIVQNKYKGKLPNNPEILQTFPGIGKATACSIVVFSFDTPLSYIETNIRRVFIHHFFKNKTEVHDRNILPLVEQTLDRKNPREWYYALMDYGSYLSKVIVNPNRRSAHYAKPSQFNGSLRQIRGEILKTVLNNKSLNKNQLKKEVKADTRFDKALEQLKNEGFISVKQEKVSII